DGRGLGDRIGDRPSARSGVADGDLLALEVIDRFDVRVVADVDVCGLGVERGEPAEVVEFRAVEVLEFTVDGIVGGIALGEAQLPLALVHLAAALRRGTVLHVADGDLVDIALDARGQLSTERVVRSRGAAGSEGEVVRGLTAAAFTPTGSAGSQGQGERSNGRCGDASNRH